jgi:indoleamine 2,3-dioxygenase
MALLEVFDISKNGFLPERCVCRFPKELVKYQEILNSMHNLSTLEFRNLVRSVSKQTDKKSLDDISKFSLEERKFFYSALSMIVNKYIWCDCVDSYAKEIPENLGLLWYSAAKSINIVPVLTHAAVDLFNWSLINENESALDYEPTDNEKMQKNCKIAFQNIMINYTMTDSIDENWFYLIMVAIEFYGNRIINIIENINDCMTYRNNDAIVGFLYELQVVLKKITNIIKKMYEHCDPKVFFEVIRIYLAGFDKKYFPNGLIIENTDIKIDNYRGGSAAQSSLIQVLDVLLHENEIGCEFSKRFLDEMLDYMPQKHRNYIEYLRTNKKTHNLREHVLHSGDHHLIEQYNTCLNQLKLFRAAHFELVKNYVFRFTGEQAKGTGGTDAKEFLQDLITDTNRSTIKYNTNLNTNNFISISPTKLVCYALVGFMMYNWWHIFIKQMWWQE